MDAPHDLLNRFLLAKSAAGKSPLTLGWYKDLLSEYLEYAEVHGLDWFTADAIDAFQSHLWKRGFLPNSVDCYYRALRAWFNWQVRRKLCAASPMTQVERPKRPSDPVDHVTLSEFLLLLASIEGDSWTEQRDRCLLQLIYWSGLRVGEATGLSLTDIDLVHRLVTIHRGKGGKSRFVPCAPTLATPLLAYLLARPPFDGTVLFISNDGAGGARGPLSVEGVRQMLRRRCKAANVRYMRPHLFRHGFAMLFLNNGMQMSAVAAAMGHSSQQTTASIYAHWLTEGLTREYEAVTARVGRMMVQP